MKKVIYAWRRRINERRGRKERKKLNEPERMKSNRGFAEGSFSSTHHWTYRTTSYCTHFNQSFFSYELDPMPQDSFLYCLREKHGLGGMQQWDWWQQMGKIR